MAIIKELDSNFGCPVTYHRISAISINYRLKKVIICVASYLDKEARRRQFNALEEIDIEVPLEDFLHFKDTNVLENGYQWLKENVVGFEDCLDDFEVMEPLELFQEQKDLKQEVGEGDEQESIY